MEDVDACIKRIDDIISNPSTSSNSNSNIQNKEKTNTIKHNSLLFSGGYNTFEQIESLVKRVYILHTKGVYIPPPKSHICNKNKRKRQPTKSEILEQEEKAPKKTLGSGRVGVSCEMYGFKKCTCCNHQLEEDYLLDNVMDNQPICNEIHDESQSYIDLTAPNTSIIQPTYLMDDSVISISDSSPCNSSDEVIALDDTELETNSSLVIKIENLSNTHNPETSVLEQVANDLDEIVMRQIQEELDTEIQTIEPKSPEIKTEKNDFHVNASNYANVENITDYIDLITTDCDKELIETIHNDILEISTPVMTPKKDDKLDEAIIEAIHNDLLEISTPEITPEKHHINKPSKNDDYKENLPPVIPKSDNSTPKMCCSICLDALKGKEIMSTICGHLFCSECIKEAIKKTKACPNCRKKLTLKSIHPIYLS